MHFMYWSARLFFGLFMLNLSNLVINWEGGQLQKDDFDVGDFMRAALTWHTLGNSAVDGVLGKGAHSYGVIEFFTSAILVATSSTCAAASTRSTRASATRTAASSSPRPTSR